MNLAKKLTATILAVISALTFIACSDITDSSSSSGGGNTERSDEAKLTFVSINDIHGTIEQDADGLHGLSNTAKIIDKMSANYASGGDVRDDVVLFGNGDMFQGTAISNLSKGRAVIEAMNAMRFDGMGLGNHEFDWGLDVVTAYFDGDESNGEANFPLVAANVYQKSQSRYIADESLTDNIVNGLIVEKSGVKVGLIGVIGPCENSILQKRVADYSFREEYITNRVKDVATELRNDGAEIISVNVHWGDYYNEELANIKSGSDYLVDVIFNGHTHQQYKDEIRRGDGRYVPVVQGGRYNEAVAYVKLTYSTVNGNVEINSYGCKKVSDYEDEYDDTVENVVSSYAETLIDNLPVLATSAVTVNHAYTLTGYVGKLMTKALDSDYSASNYGGLRSNGDIEANKPIKEDAFYKIIPFDNAVYLVEIQGKGLYEYYENCYVQPDSDSKRHYFGKSDTAKNFSELKNDENYYTLAIIDYVYTGTYFSPYKKYIRKETETPLLLRDLLVEDAKLFGAANVKWSYSNEPLLGSLR